MNEQSGIEIYPVGALADWKHGRLRLGVRNYLWYQIQRRNWRAVRSYFNGYLAEWDYPPEGMKHYRCGRGWTKRAALRRFGVHIAESNLLPTPRIVRPKGRR
jgi:hypothetical protein